MALGPAGIPALVEELVSPQTKNRVEILEQAVKQQQDELRSLEKKIQYLQRQVELLNQQSGDQGSQQRQDAPIQEQITEEEGEALAAALDGLNDATAVMVEKLDTIHSTMQGVLSDLRAARSGFAKAPEAPEAPES